MLFVRDFAGFFGGHLKYLDYMKHTAASELVEPVLYQTAHSRAAPGNVFNDYEGRTIDRLRPFPVYFIAGEDWFILEGAGIKLDEARIVNLIQGFRHTELGCLLADRWAIAEMTGENHLLPCKVITHTLQSNRSYPPLEYVIN